MPQNFPVNLLTVLGIMEQKTEKVLEFNYA
jgi:hypothetical protein